MTVLLEAHAMSRRLPGGAWLLQDVSVDIYRGDRIAIRGPAGAGKTLLLRALALLDPLDSGEIRWRSEPVSDDEVPGYRCRVGYLHQSPALVEGTVEDNLRLPFTLRVHQDRDFEIGRVLELLERLGRRGRFLERPTAELSGGERQILALVRLLQLDPVLLLLDEPTASLDPETSRQAAALITSWAEEPGHERAYVWVSHDPALADEHANRRLHLERGGLLREG